MLAFYYIVIDDQNPDLHHQMDGEGMQEYVIQKSALEGVLYHSEMIEIKILYNIDNGEVRLVDTDEKKGVSFDYSNAYLTQRKQVEIAIRRLVKMELIRLLNQMNDIDICEIVKLHHEIDPATGKICSNTSEIALDMTLVKIFKLGYFEISDSFSLARLIGLSRKNQTRTQRAIYSALEDFKRECENSSKVLDEFKSKNSIQQFKKHIEKYL